MLAYCQFFIKLQIIEKKIKILIKIHKSVGGGGGDRPVERPVTGAR